MLVVTTAGRHGAILGGVKASTTIVEGGTNGGRAANRGSRLDRKHRTRLRACIGRQTAG
jgi:hypothetical protein